ncbi:MAG: hypothetical protein FK734_07490, partial [Asgard group archaeon]|nr:hypothetical protein [Asgard group archaeon]
FDDNLANKDLQIQHHSKLPMQAGFGSSGAGAIGTAFALNDALKMNYTNQELGQIAHKAEVHCSTGLGDVIAQMHAGAEIRLEPGGPGIGKIQSMIWPDDIKIVTIALGTISTKKVITNPKHILEINKTSEKLLSELLENPSLDSFIEISYTFAVQAHLMTPQVKDLVETLRANNFPSSMIMLGQSVFTILTSNKAKDCASFLKKIYPNANIMISTLATQGPIKIDNQ